MKKILFILMLYISLSLMSCTSTHTMMSNIYRLDSSGNIVESWNEINSSDIIKYGEGIQFGSYILGGSVPYKIETYIVSNIDSETISSKLNDCDINRLIVIKNLENDIVLLKNKESQLKILLNNKDNGDYKKHQRDFKITRRDIQACNRALDVLKSY